MNIVVLIVLSATGVFTVSCQVCRNGWSRFNDSCYLFGHVAMEWPLAITICKNFEARLIEIETSAENKYIETTVREKHDHDSATHYYWLGASNIEIDDEFRWIGSDSPLSFTGWHPGQPDFNGGRDDCAALYSPTGYDWHDIPCTDKGFFICEQRTENIQNVIGR